MIKLFFLISDVIRTDDTKLYKHTNHANNDLHRKFSNVLLILFCFMIKMDLFQAKVVTLASGALWGSKYKWKIMSATLWPSLLYTRDVYKIGMLRINLLGIECIV